MKPCRDCGIELTSLNKSTRTTGYICKECDEKRHKIYRQTRKLKSFTSKALRVREWSIKTLANHKYFGYKISITLQELMDYAMIIDRCEYTGIELDWFVKNKPADNSPSLDRLNNENELRLDNIRIVCKKINTMKQNLTFKEYLNHCKFMIEKFGDVLNET